MQAPVPDIPRRHFLGLLGGLAVAVRTGCAAADAAGAAITRAIPATGERLPVIGVGSWITFNVTPEPDEETGLVPVIQKFFALGGSMVDSSPMYGHSEAVIGDLLRQVPQHARLFSATKIWTPSVAMGRWQLEQSRKLWDVPRFDLVHVHNMVNWEGHLETLKAQQAAGRVRYIGITTSHGQLHDEMARALGRTRFDFAQFTYNLADRRVEQRLLPLCAERGIAVVINRPFDGGRLFDKVRGKPLPGWASELDCQNWAQLFLKFVVSHPAVTCAVPATHQAAHMVENMGALYGRVPDAEMRARIARALDQI